MLATWSRTQRSKPESSRLTMESEAQSVTKPGFIVVPWRISRMLIATALVAFAIPFGNSPAIAATGSTVVNVYAPSPVEGVPLSNTIVANIVFNTPAGQTPCTGGTAFINWGDGT